MSQQLRDVATSRPPLVPAVAPLRRLESTLLAAVGPVEVAVLSPSPGQPA
jgi:hypothetical protein